MERTRRARLRQGALSWGLSHDAAQPGRCIEVFVDENWLEQRLALHQGPEPLWLDRMVADGRAAAPDP